MQEDWEFLATQIKESAEYQNELAKALAELLPESRTARMEVVLSLMAWQLSCISSELTILRYIGFSRSFREHDDEAVDS